MSTDTVLYILLSLSVVASLFGVRMNAELRHLIKTKLTQAQIISLGLLRLAQSAAFVALTFTTGYWQFAGIILTGFVINVAGSQARKGVKA